MGLFAEASVEFHVIPLRDEPPTQTYPSCWRLREEDLDEILKALPILKALDNISATPAVSVDADDGWQMML